LIIDPLHSDFDRSGLIKSSTLRLDHLVTQWWDEKRAALKKDLAKASGITHLLQDKSKSLTLEDVWGDVLELTNSASLQK
jgi:hypothetical protein